MNRLLLSEKKDWNHNRNYRYITYVLGGLLLFLLLSPILCLRDYSLNNELRYLSIADEALRDGHMFGFMHQGELYADKPPLYLWLIMCTKKISGCYPMGLLSLFSILPAFVILGVMSEWTHKELGKAGVLSSAFILMTTGLFTGSAVFIRMDMLMCMFIILSLYLFYRIYSGQNRPYEKWLLAVSLFLGVFTKGPYGLILPLLSIFIFLIYKRQIKTLNRYLGWKQIILLLVLFISWFGIVWIEKGGEYLHNLLFNQTVNRAVDSFSHKQPFYYYGKIIGAILIPWTLFILTAIITGIKRKLITGDKEKFFLITILSQFVFVSLISSKLAIYILPVIPFIIYFTVLIVGKTCYTSGLAVSIWMTILLLTFSLPIYLYVVKSTPDYKWLETVQPFVITGWIINLLFNGYALYKLHTQKDILYSAGIIAAGILCFIFITGWGLPRINDRIGYQQVCETAVSLSTHENCSYYACGIGRPEHMDVLIGKPVRKISPEELLSGNYAGNILLIEQHLLGKHIALYDYLKEKPCVYIGECMVVCL